MVKWSKPLVVLFILVFSLLISIKAFSETNPENKNPEPKILNVPYGFYNEAFGTAIAYVYGITGFPQTQAGLLGTAMVGSRGSVMAFGMARDLQPSFFDQLFVDSIIQIGSFKEIRSYSDGNPSFVGQDAGTNNSDPDNFIEGDGWDNFFRVNFKYMLPIGFGNDPILLGSDLEGGLPTNPIGDLDSFNPFVTGRTFFELKPFYRFQEINSEFIDGELKTNGLEASLFHDRRDFIPSPSRGSAYRFRIIRDWGLFDSSAPYLVYSGEMDKYFSLGKSKHFRQRVLAFNFWTSETPTWNDSDMEGGQQIFHRPPAYAGSTLGGIWRMRGFRGSRFNDRAGIFYATELRLIPEWNPLENWKWLQEHAGIQWWQWVTFVEVGRVGPTWRLTELHDEMKWDLGLGVRAFAKGIVLRVDMAVSEEDFNVQMMIGQPFQF